MPFVTLADPDLVGGTADDPACCQDPALLSCGAATILPSALGKQGSIELPNNIVLKYAGHVGGNKRSYSYLGEGGARATITCSQDKHCNGNARSAAGEDYVLEYCGEVGHMWKQPNMEEMRDGDPDDIVGGGQGSQEEDEDLDLTTPVSYSIKFYYTREFAQVTKDIDGFIDHSVTRTNQAYINSHVPLSAFVLCQEVARGLEEAGTAKQMLERFAQLKGSIEELRDTADVAVLLTSRLVGGYCGRASSLTGYKTRDTLSVVQKSCLQSSARNTLAHEIGHNFGLAHDPATLAEQKAKPVYAYGTGHLVEQGQSKNSLGFRTIMAYSKANHKIGVNYFSNPDVVLKETLTPTGTVTSNNAQVLLRNRFRIAALGDESSTACAVGNEYEATSFEEKEEEQVLYIYSS